MEYFKEAVRVLQELAQALQGKENPCNFFNSSGLEYSDNYYKTQPVLERKKHILPPIRADPIY